MMLVTSKPINSKEDAVGILRTYMSRWHIEEYFRFKKEECGFENIRVHSLLAIKVLLHSKVIRRKYVFGITR